MFIYKKRVAHNSIPRLENVSLLAMTLGEKDGGT